MKVFLFISYLWVLVFSQTMFASNNDKSETVKAPVQVSSAPYKEREKLYCREDVTPESLPDYSGTVPSKEIDCGPTYENHQIQISEARERHEYRVWMDMTPAPITLVQSNYQF